MELIIYEYHNNLTRTKGSNLYKRKLKVLSLPETIQETSTFRAKALPTPDERPLLQTSIFPLSSALLGVDSKQKERKGSLMQNIAPKMV